MSLLFIGFVFIISSLVILYSDDYIFGDLNIVRFILLVLMFVSIMFLIVSPNVISTLLGREFLQAEMSGGKYAFFPGQL